MDVFDTLDVLENHVRASPWIPFANRRAVDRDLMVQLLRAAREQVERARREPQPGGSRDEVLSLAQSEGRLIVETARQEAQETLRDDRISSLSRQQFDEIVGVGRQQANLLIREAYTYSVERMTEIERSLHKLRSQVGEGREAAQKTIKDAEKARRQRRKEISREKKKARRGQVKRALF